MVDRDNQNKENFCYKCKTLRTRDAHNNFTTEGFQSWVPFVVGRNLERYGGPRTALKVGKIHTVGLVSFEEALIELQHRLLPILQWGKSCRITTPTGKAPSWTYQGRQCFLGLPPWRQHSKLEALLRARNP
eukprot:4923831-Amphidinium_carterae.1